MQMEMTVDLATHITEEQAKAVQDAHKYIKEDRDRSGAPRMLTDFNIHIDQLGGDGEIVRTWIAMPNGKLTWKS